VRPATVLWAPAIPSAKFPAIAAQHAEYLQLQLKAFRAMERTNDAGQMMRSIAAKLTDLKSRRFRPTFRACNKGLGYIRLNPAKSCQFVGWPFGHPFLCHPSHAFSQVMNAFRSARSKKRSLHDV
jgi:hypothetical protein